MDGRFEAVGGSGNDVEVFVLSGDAFNQWTNNQQAPAFYNSSRQGTDTLNVQLPATTEAPVTYYLVFNNRFSVFSNKAITSDIKLHYTRAL